MLIQLFKQYKVLTRVLLFISNLNWKKLEIQVNINLKFINQWLQNNSFRINKTKPDWLNSIILCERNKYYEKERQFSYECNTTWIKCSIRWLDKIFGLNNSINTNLILKNIKIAYKKNYKVLSTHSEDCKIFTILFHF